LLLAGAAAAPGAAIAGSLDTGPRGIVVGVHVAARVRDAGPVPQGVQGERTLRAGGVAFIHAPADSALAAALAAVPGLGQLPALPADILTHDPPITVYLARNAAAFDSLTGGRAPDWGAGVAFPADGMIVLPAYASRRGPVHGLHQVLRHELAHVALQRYLGPLQVPHWFTEGYATWAAGQLDTEAGWLLRLAFLTGRAPPLDSLALSWPARTTDARVAYLLSASVIRYLYDNGGDRSMRLFLERWRDDGRLEQALFDTYGLGLAQLEKYWSRDVRRRYGWLTFAAQSVVIWMVVAFAVVALFVVRRRRDRAHLDRLRATEPPDDPEYWVHVDRSPGDNPDR